MPGLKLVFSTLLSLSLAASAGAQPPQPGAPLPTVIDGLEAGAVSQGWALLMQGRFAEAATRGSELLKLYPKSAAVLVLAVDAHMAASGAVAGLDVYEGWLGQRRLEEPAVLRRVALAVLREQARQTDAGARFEALSALAAAQALKSSPEGATVDRLRTRALAAAGDESAVRTVVKELQTGQTNSLGAIQILSRSRSRVAVPALLERLKDPQSEVRGMAADALGRLGGSSENRQVIAGLKAALGDQDAFVRARSALALYRLNDDSGISIVSKLRESESAADRLNTAEAMLARSDPAWLDLARGLIQAEEPEIRVHAARLLADREPQLAQATLDELSRHANPVIREMAVRTMPDAAAGDLATLRRLLRAEDGEARARAAARIIELTR